MRLLAVFLIALALPVSALANGSPCLPPPVLDNAEAARAIDDAVQEDLGNAPVEESFIARARRRIGELSDAYGLSRAQVVERYVFHICEALFDRGTGGDRLSQVMSRIRQALNQPPEPEQDSAAGQDEENSAATGGDAPVTDDTFETTTQALGTTEDPGDARAEASDGADARGDNGGEQVAPDAAMPVAPESMADPAPGETGPAATEPAEEAPDAPPGEEFAARAPAAESAPSPDETEANTARAEPDSETGTATGETAGSTPPPATEEKRAGGEPNAGQEQRRITRAYRYAPERSTGGEAEEGAAEPQTDRGVASFGRRSSGDAEPEPEALPSEPAAQPETGAPESEAEAPGVPTGVAPSELSTESLTTPSEAERRTARPPQPRAEPPQSPGQHEAPAESETAASPEQDGAAPADTAETSPDSDDAPSNATGTAAAEPPATHALTAARDATDAAPSENGEPEAAASEPESAETAARADSARGPCPERGVLGPECFDVDQALERLNDRPVEYNHPPEMIRGQTTEISLVLRTDFTAEGVPKEVSEAFETLQGEVQQQRAKIANVMSARLRGRDFEVDPAGMQERTVTWRRPVEWSWYVTPKTGGENKRLKLELYAHIVNPQGERQPPVLIKTLDATIDVDVHTLDWLIEQARTFEPIYAVAAAIIGLFTALVTVWMRRRPTYPGDSGPPSGITASQTPSDRHVTDMSADEAAAAAARKGQDEDGGGDGSPPGNGRA